MTPTAAKWDERVRDWRASGKTAEEFAVGQNFEASTLRYWASRLKTEGPSKSAMAMARVVRRESRTVRKDAVGGEVEVIVGEARIVVRRGFDAELLRDVTAALGATR
jgi:hypothetical protein